MQTYQYVYVVLALVIWLLSYLHTGRHLRSRWKTPGKFIFYVGLSILTALAVGHFSLMFIVGFPAIGLIHHTHLCEKHGINWWTCEPLEEYLALQNKWENEL